MNNSWVSCYSKPLAEDSLLNLGKPDLIESRKEINAWLNQLKREFPNKEFHIQMLDEGYIVALFYKDYEEKEALEIVENLPFNWDYEARIELGKEYFNKRFKKLVGIDDKNP